jgi:hypothetical protein
MHACDPSTWEDPKFKVSLGYIVRPFSKTINKRIK